MVVLALGPQVFAVAASSTVEAVVEQPSIEVEPATNTEITEANPKQDARIPIVILPEAFQPPEPAYPIPPATPFIEEVSSWARAMSPQRQMEVVALTNKTARLVDHCLHREFDISQYSITVAAYSPNEEFVALGSVDGVVYLIECDTGELMARFTSPASDIRSLDISPNGELLAVGTKAGKVHVIEIESRAELTVISMSAAVNSVRFSPNGLLAVSSGSWLSPDEGELLLWNTAAMELEAELVTGAAQGIALFASNDEVAAVSWDGSVTTYDVGSRRVTNQLQIAKDLVSQAEFSSVNDSPLIDAVEASKETQISQLPVRFIYEGQIYESTGEGYRLIVPELQ